MTAYAPVRAPPPDGPGDRRPPAVTGQAAGAPGPDSLGPSAGPSRQSLSGLDWFIFFLADVQTGFGPFVSVYLTTQKWSQVERFVNGKKKGT